MPLPPLFKPIFCFAILLVQISSSTSIINGVSIGFGLKHLGFGVREGMALEG